MINKSSIIHINLLDEGLEVSRPIKANRIEENIYKISLENKHPEWEVWEFNKGDVVKCEERTSDVGETYLLAIEKVE